LLTGQVLTENRRMLHFVETLGFHRAKMVDTDIVEMVLDLKADQSGANVAVK
jgi:acetyltransferase